MMVSSPRRTGSATTLVVALLLATVVTAPGVGAADVTGGAGFWVRSPYGSLTKTQRMLDTVALRVLLELDYSERQANQGAWKTTGAPGVEFARYFDRAVDDMTKSVELAITRYPEGGFEIYVYGVERDQAGARVNGDLQTIRERLDDLIEQLLEETKDPKHQRVAYRIFPLSYIQSDRAIALLKTLGFTTVEYSAEDGSIDYDKIFAPSQTGEWKLPAVVKLIDSMKTSLMDPSELDLEDSEDHEDPATLPDLGGLYLHGITSGEPPQRLLLVYDPDEPESLKRILSLLSEQVDVPARQILIEALVIELNADRLTDLGVSYGLGGVKGSGNNRDQLDSSLGESEFFPGEDGTFNPFTFIFNRSTLGDLFNFRAGLKTMVDRGEAEVLSNPSVLVLDGRQARIQIGQNLPVVETTTTNVAVESSVSYFPVGIVLNLRPRVAANASEIIMQVETIVSSVALSLSSGSVQFAPVVDNRQVQTFVRVADNTPFIIGGLISSETQDRVSGIPLLSDIPVLGALFSRTTKQRVKKEVIVVLTPHVVPDEAQTFGYVIPQDSDVFDDLDHRLFRNAYRLRDSDVFDLDYLYQSASYKRLKQRVEEAAEARLALADVLVVNQVLEGAIPGEEILVRRMLWEIARRSGLGDKLDVKKIIFFREDPKAPDGVSLGNLGKELSGRRDSATYFTFDTRLEGTEEHPFVQPRAFVTTQALAPDLYPQELSLANQRLADGQPDQWTVIIGKASGITAPPIEMLKNVLIMKRLLALNPTLPLRIKEWYGGREIVFPTDSDITDRYHLMDPVAARYFYEAVLYYPAFEQEFKYQMKQILAEIDQAGQ